MMIIAKSPKGREFVYSPRTAHRVNARKARKVCDALNACGFMLEEGETWYPHEVADWETAAIYAEGQRFTVYADGSIVRRWR